MSEQFDIAKLVEYDLDCGCRAVKDGESWTVVNCPEHCGPLFNPREGDA